MLVEVRVRVVYTTCLKIIGERLDKSQRISMRWFFLALASPNSLREI
jgi:hypothetical protein